MIQAIVDLYPDGASATIRANSLCNDGWSVAISGPNAGTDVQVELGQPTQHDEGWVVLASRTDITIVCQQ